MRELTNITGGKTVEDFLTDLNNNFNIIKNDANVSRTITFSTNEPNAQTAGKNGDIWIVYE